MPETAARRAALPSPAEKAGYVRELFGAIAPRYDLLNHLLSANIDRRWRRRAVDQLNWERRPHGRFLDSCSGTFDLAIELEGRSAFQGSVVAADFTFQMLKHGLTKLESRPIHPACADAQALPFPDQSFDGVTVGFGVRNLSDLDLGFREAFRVLTPGSRLVVLEFTTPRFAPLRALYLAYFRHILPALGALISGHRKAYSYLPESVMDFPNPARLAGRMRDAGFENVDYTLLTGGIAALHWGRRPGGD